MKNKNSFEEFINHLDMNGFEELTCDATRPLLDRILDHKEHGDNLWGDYLSEDQLNIRRCLTCKLAGELVKGVDPNEPIDFPWLMNLITVSITWGMIAQDEIKGND